jgi:hypothetical protein
MSSTAKLTCLFVAFLASSAMSQTPVTCPDVEALEAKCQEYQKENEACSAQVSEGIKANIQARKNELDECKKKYNLEYIVKCRKELKAANTAANTPKQVAGNAVQKDLLAKPDSSCAKADAMGKANVVCKGPKKILDAMKKNCIQPAPQP